MNTITRIAIAIMATCSYFLYSCAGENHEIMDDITITATIDEITSKYAVATIEYDPEITSQALKLVENKTGETVSPDFFYPSTKMVLTSLQPNTTYSIVFSNFSLRVKNGEFRTPSAQERTSCLPAYAKLEVLEASPTSVIARIDAEMNKGIDYFFYNYSDVKLYYSKSQNFEDTKSISVYLGQEVNIKGLDPETEYYYYLEGEFTIWQSVYINDYQEYNINHATGIIYPLEDNATFSTAPSTPNSGTE